MAFYTLTPFIGPVLGPLISGFINQVSSSVDLTVIITSLTQASQNLDWRWMYRVLLVWVFVEWIALLLVRLTSLYQSHFLTIHLHQVVPETYVPVILKHKAQRLRRSTGNAQYWAPLEKQDMHILVALQISCYKPFRKFSPPSSLTL